MKKMSRKNFRGGPLFSSKSSASHGPSSSSPGVNGPGSSGIMRRATWADKIRDKLPPLGENEYEVLWERGVLGVIFLESEKDGIPYVSKATESCISPAVSQGDILKYVNVVRSKDHSFSDFFKILATMKKPVLLRFERMSASTPSSDEDEASQLFGVQRSSSTNAVNSASHYARQNVPTPDEGDPTGKFQRANSVPQKDQKPPKATRGAFWRAPSAKDSVGPGNPAQSVGPNGMNGGNDRMGASQAQRCVPSNRDHQVSPRDAVPANGSGGHSFHSPLGPHEYQVYWETGSLGLFFGEDRATNLPVVTRSTPSANPVVQRAVAINDTLVSANGIKSADYTFEAFFGRLQQMNKPVRLVFRRRQPNDQVVIVKQGEQQQQQRQQQQQLQQQLQQRQQQMREQQEIREQEQKRELLKIREQQQREQQIREQQQREQQQREQQQREQQLREQQLREQQLREQQQREQQLREQQQREQQLREQQQREQQLREQQQREQQLREQQQREKQLREQEEREQQQREEQQREQQQREKQLREQEEREQQQREEQQREQQQREKQLREQEEREQQQREEQQREQQQREKQLREQEEREQQQREEQQREQQQREKQLREQEEREQQQREEQQREQQQREKQLREQEEREQQQREEQRRQQEAALRNRTPSVTVDTSPSPSALPAEGRTAYHNRTPSPTVKCASTPPPRPPSPQVRLESTDNYRHADRANMRTPPPNSPVMARKQETSESVPSTNYDVSPKASTSPLVQSSPRVDISPQFGMSPGASPNIGSSPKVSSSPLASPISPFVATEIANETSNPASSPVAQDEYEYDASTDYFPVDEEHVPSPKASQHIFEKSHGRRSRNSSEEQRQHQKATIAMHEEDPVLSPVSKTSHLSPTEPWDLPEQLPSPTIKAEPIEVDEDDDVDVGVPVSPSGDSHLDHVVMAEEAELGEEAELVEEAELAEEAESVEEAELAQEAELADEAELSEEAELAEEVELALLSHPVVHSVEDDTELDVEVGMLADVEVGIAVDETESEAAETIASHRDESSSPWDLEPDSDRQKADHHGCNHASSPDEASSSSSGSSSIESAADMSKVDFADASETTDEFANDPDISGDIDIVDSEIMLQEPPKHKVDSANVPKPTKSSLYANLAKYKKKGKTSRGVIKLPALGEEEALTVPLVAPNAVNTTVQVRGRPKPKFTMADTPDSTTYLIKWKENRSIGLQLKEVRFAKGTYPLVTDVCQEPCCELLRHICVGDVIIEINGRNTSTMGVKKTVNFLKTCTKTTLMKIRHGPGFVNQRVRATV